MSHTVNHLRTHRKQTHITQSDIAFLLDKEDRSHLSRCERGNRAPSMSMLITYHLLFNTPVVSFFASQRKLVKRELTERMKLLIRSLENEEPTAQVLSRIAYLKSALTRLTNETYEN